MQLMILCVWFQDHALSEMKMMFKLIYNSKKCSSFDYWFWLCSLTEWVLSPQKLWANTTVVVCQPNNYKAYVASAKMKKVNVPTKNQNYMLQ